MSDEVQRQMLETLREIRAGQREALAVMAEQKALVEEQLRASRKNVEESVGLQRLALRRQQLITVIAIPGIVACIAAIGYLIVRYF